MSTTTRNEDAYLEEGLLRNMEEEKVNLLHEHRNETTNEGQLPLDKPRRNGPSLCTLMALTCLGFIAGVTVFAPPTMMCRHSHQAQANDELVASNNLTPAQKIYIQVIEEHADMGYDEQFQTFEKRAQDPAANGILNRSVAGTGANPQPGGTSPGQIPGVPGNPGAERTTEITTQTTTSTSYTTVTPGSPSSSPPVISSSHPPSSVIPSSSIPHSSAPISSSSPIISSSSIPSSSSTPTSSSTSSSTSIPSTSSSSSLPPPVSSTSSTFVECLFAAA
ncbi:hypothetical protein VHEMI00968 [[Torrubiella] hemipterigena]|uniref:Uncharacterized protein n=1 Tax=[Torrubiella] hemipterigena TaxID=1531966 RepID=A0A0A1T3F8_9HYPO|nr:hypothetical protein VHEMI00968 [[Torrubiella] hemipterigena]